MNENSFLIGEIDTDGTETDFFRALDVWISKPHVINRRLCGTKRFYFEDSLISFEDNLLPLTELVSAILPNIPSSSILETTLHNFYRIRGYCKLQTSVIIAQKLLPRHSKHLSGVEIVILDKSSLAAVFIPIYESNEYVLTPKFTYAVQLRQKDKERRIVLTALTAPRDEFSCTFTWLNSCVLPKLKKWSESPPVSPVIPSLSAISIEKYNDLYLLLKEKYGPELVQKWQEKTDPHKYVYEDIAIATYLLLLWDQEREEHKLVKRQSFVDLGCGNGLLVHILTNEGYEGSGLDVRKRKIWDYFGTRVVLKETPIVLSPLTKYPKCDWLIGNHSDELTPWIPVFASRSSYNTRFFLLPCCCYDFNCKFQRPSSLESQYRSYINYISEISDKCGFHVIEDKLRIPSTKRICLIGMKRTYKEADSQVVDKRLLDFIKERCSKLSECDGDQNNHSTVKELVNGSETNVQADKLKTETLWDVHIKVREGKEPVRNCTQLDRNLIAYFVNLVTSTLLSLSKEFIQIVQADGNCKTWNPGGTLKLSDIVQLVDKLKLVKLKSECGGLQTLLKNHGHIFKVMQGKVSLRNYCDEEFQKNCNTKNIKTKPCWFHQNHPDGCLLVSDMCRFIH